MLKIKSKFMQTVFHQPGTSARKASVMALFCALAVGAEANLSKLPHRESVPVGMESRGAGTVIESFQGITDAEALISDITAGCHVSGGGSEVTLKFPHQAVFEKLSFVNDGIEGEVRVYSSADSKRWIPLGGGQVRAGDRQFVLNSGSSQGRYVKVEFDTQKSGTIRCLRVLGNATDVQYQIRQPEDGSGKPLNLADGIGGGRMIYATMNESETGERMVVYDLGRQRLVSEFGSVHSRQPVNFRVYAFDALPEKENWRGRMQLSLQDVVRAATLLADVNDPGQGVARAKLDRPAKARYIALSWKAAQGNAPTDFVSYDVTVTGTCVAAWLPAEGAALADSGSAPNPQNSGPHENPAADEAETRSDRDSSAMTALFTASQERWDDGPSQGLTVPAFYSHYLGARDVIAGAAFASGGRASAGASKSAGFGNGRAKANEEPVEGDEVAAEEEFEGPPVFLEWSRAPSAP